MALDERVLQPGDTLVPGRCYIVFGLPLPDDLRGPIYAGNGLPVVAPDDDQILSIGEWMTALGATEILTCDIFARRTAFADSGLDIFEV